MTLRTQIKMLVAFAFIAASAAAMLIGPSTHAQDNKSSFSPVVEEPFAVVLKRDKANKARVMAEHQKLLEARYDLSRRVDPSVTMTRGKPIPVGPTARLKS